jgi:3-oxoacyl-[acyl-carrier protein] reductase
MPDGERPRPRSVVVTGGSSGIGAAFCRLAARRLWHVWVGYASGADRARRLVAELTAEGGSAAAAALPLGDRRCIADSIAAISCAGPPPEAVVLCGAPAPDVVPFLKLTPEHFRRQLDAALVGNHALLAEMWRACFRPRGGGHVLAVLSAAQGPPTAPHMASYVAAKSGLETLLRAAAAELGPAGLRVSVVHPGFVETPMLRSFEPRLLERARATALGGGFLDPGAVAWVLLRGLEEPPQPGKVAELSIDVHEAVS